MLKNEWNEWKYNFSEMKVDVGMSPREKEREQEDSLASQTLSPREGLAGETNKKMPTQKPKAIQPIPSCIMYFSSKARK